ncbi:MAG: hypothetical protein C0399_12020 [Syntrophus sp. (in: bacteria)]|nr:hypothetical protein [Syntrophus sp. (in: bacteria)]
MPFNILKSNKLQALPFHSFLVVTFQILTIYAANVNIAKISSAMLVLLMAVIITAVMFLLFSFITKDIKRAAIFVTFYCFLFFAYGRLYDIVPGLPIAGWVIGRNKFLLVLYALIIIASTLWIIRSLWCRKYIETITYFLNIFSLGLVIVAALTALISFDRATFGIKTNVEVNKSDIKREAHPALHSRKNILKPNVYCLFFDSYASHKVLKKYYGWDDSRVVEALRGRGFSVNRNAYANYPFTALSIGSTLNMRYIHEDRGFIDAMSKGGYLSEILEQNEVMQRFNSEGYDVVHVEQKFNNYINTKGIYNLLSNDFFSMVVHVSILRVIEFEITADALRNKRLTNIEELKLFNVPEKPAFIYSHIICPHPPYIFNADGSKPSLLDSAFGRYENKRGYINQVRFIGTQIIEIVDSLRRRDPRAVIIIQADHGHGYIIGDYLLDLKRPPLEFLDAQYGILQAIYLPQGIVMPEIITSVNLFRYVINALFDEKLEVLPDRAFFTRIKEPFIFYEVTSELEHIKNE